MFVQIQVQIQKSIKNIMKYKNSEKQMRHSKIMSLFVEYQTHWSMQFQCHYPLLRP